MSSGNTFATTIAVLSSAVQSIARVSSVSPGMVFFRALERDHLPISFFRPDAEGRCGYAEWGFLSTTSDKRFALMDSHRLSTVLVISESAVDRGADVSNYSQYPNVTVPHNATGAALNYCAPFKF